MTQTLSQLENSGAFIERHIGPDAAQQQEMLNAVGAQSLNALTGKIVPKRYSTCDTTAGWRTGDRIRRTGRTQGYCQSQ